MDKKYSDTKVENMLGNIKTIKDMDKEPVNMLTVANILGDGKIKKGVWKKINQLIKYKKMD